MFDIEKIKNLILLKYGNYKDYIATFDKIYFTDVYITPEEKIQNKLLNKEQIYIFQNDVQIYVEKDCITINMYLKSVLYNEYIRVFSFSIDSENELDNMFLNIDNIKKTIFNLNIKKTKILRKIKKKTGYPGGEWDFYGHNIITAKNEINKQNNILDINLIYNNKTIDIVVRRYLMNLINEVIIEKVLKSLIKGSYLT